jgi:Rieske Fe-S protein
VTEHKFTRRQAMGAAAVAGVGVPLLAACGSGEAIDSESATTSGPQKLGPTSDVPVGGGKIYPDANVVVTQPTQGTFEGFVATCTHQGCQVSSVADGTIDCACHGSRFSIKDGSVVNGPATLPLHTAKLTVTGNEIATA